MLESLKDYIFVSNAIPREQCEILVKEISHRNIWESHTWQNYGKTLAKNNLKYPFKELDVAESHPEQNKVIYPFMGKAINAYEQRLVESNSSDNFLANCGLHICCPVRFNRYNQHTLMRPHYDHIHSLFDGERKGIPIISIVGVLNEDYEGGEFIFWDNYKVELHTGDILIFPSNFLYTHRVSAVKKGTRYSWVSWGW